MDKNTYLVKKLNEIDGLDKQINILLFNKEPLYLKLFISFSIFHLMLISSSLFLVVNMTNLMPNYNKYIILFLIVFIASFLIVYGVLFMCISAFVNGFIQSFYGRKKSFNAFDAYLTYTIKGIYEYKKIPKETKIMINNLIYIMRYRYSFKYGNLKEFYTTKINEIVTSLIKEPENCYELKKLEHSSMRKKIYNKYIKNELEKRLVPTEILIK